jgi:hypothetical protein
MNRYDKAVIRNLAELQKAILIRSTLLGIQDAGSAAQTFTQIVEDAFFNDYLSHAIKVFEQSSRTASFWYVYRTDVRPIRSHASQVGFDISVAEDMSRKLKKVRNGTHFHIDKVGVLAPEKVWSDADIRGKPLAATIDFAWGALTSIQVARGLRPVDLMGYTRDIARAAVERVERPSAKPIAQTGE